MWELYPTMSTVFDVDLNFYVTDDIDLKRKLRVVQ